LKKISRIIYPANRPGGKMTVARVTEIKSSSTKSFDDAIKGGISRARKTLKNIKSAWIENQEVLLDDKGEICEYRVQMKVTFVLED
jgi:dodecin